MQTKISRRESSTLLDALSAGVVPRVGLRHIAVGRRDEVDALLHDLATIESGGAAFRFICGSYGSGKSFLIQLIRNNAMERGFVVMDADLSPERRLQGSKGQGLATYRELIQNLSTKARPDGRALEAILQKWIASLQRVVATQNSLELDDPRLTAAVSAKINEVLGELTEMAYGYAFSRVLGAYWRGMKTEDESLQQAALRWLRAEYATKAEAKNDLGVDRVIADDTWYEFTKLLALFVVRSGYKGLLVMLDEGVNLYKISHKVTRSNNYEKLLTIYNDTKSGRARYFGVFLSGTPQFIDDDRRGLNSYEAFQSRLATSRFAQPGMVDSTHPVIRLSRLTPEEIYVLLERLCQVHGACYGYDCTLSERQLTDYMNDVNTRLGADVLLTPRDISKEFIGLLNVLHQYPDKRFENLIGDNTMKAIALTRDPEQLDPAVDDGPFAEFDI